MASSLRMYKDLWMYHALLFCLLCCIVDTSKLWLIIPRTNFDIFHRYHSQIDTDCHPNYFQGKTLNGDKKLYKPKIPTARRNKCDDHNMWIRGIFHESVDTSKTHEVKYTPALKMAVHVLSQAIYLFIHEVLIDNNNGNLSFKFDSLQNDFQLKLRVGSLRKIQGRNECHCLYKNYGRSLKITDYIVSDSIYFDVDLSVTIQIITSCVEDNDDHNDDDNDDYDKHDDQHTKIAKFNGTFCNCTVGNTTHCDMIGRLECLPQFKGVDCKEDVDECETDGVCLHGNCSNYYGGFECICQSGWTGQRCDIANFNKTAGSCVSYPSLCQNGAKCDEKHDRCKCLPRYTARYCQKLKRSSSYDAYFIVIFVLMLIIGTVIIGIVAYHRIPEDYNESL